jgi:hypothetical protein
MGWWGTWLSRAGLVALLLTSLLLAPKADAQAAHQLVGHPDSRSATACHDQQGAACGHSHDHHGAAGEHSHEHHHAVLHTAGALMPPQQPKLLTGAATFTPAPPGVAAGPAPEAAPTSGTGQPPQALLQVWRI